MIDMNQPDQQMREKIDESFRMRKQERVVRALGSLGYGVVSFLLVNGLGFLTHLYKFAGTRELVWLPLSFLFWVGGSYVLGEWKWRKNERAKIS